MSDTEGNHLDDNIANEQYNNEQWVTEQFATINNSLALFKMQITDFQKIVKNIEKNVKKEMKHIQKNGTKKDKQKTKRAPSGFAKPTKVTKELCEFMNKPEGSELARTEVTKVLVNYIKEHNLINGETDSKNKIIPDEKLKNLLGLKDEDLKELNYFSIQKYMNKHFYSKHLEA